ncbi:protein kinase [Archangium violaceum]|nr:protein kinase [Archangium violaceum]
MVRRDSIMAADCTVTFPPRVPPPPPPSGTVIAGRFRIKDLAGRGGMGSVFRTTDLHTGRTVALKLLHTVSSPEVSYRFSREAALLAELHHPGIVSYVAHGTSEEGQPFLVMEWLEGEDLARRLKHQPLEPSESLALVRRAAEALSTAHRQGIVHRDIKPSNLFLRGGRPEDVVLLDFGLARHVVPTLRVTGSNMVLGTPGYMAPEQVFGQSEIPPSADIFSLGCVLYECLTGQQPFVAPHFTAVLAKILYTEPKPLHELRAGLPPGFQALVDRMLAKAPQRRLVDATCLLDSLSTLESVSNMPLPRTAEEVRPSHFAEAEQQFVSVLLVSFPVPATRAQEEERARGHALRDSMQTALAPYGARVELLADGSLVVTLVPERGAATDQAALAARCALILKERWPEAAVVLATGLGVLDEHLPVGEAMDKAGRLLRQIEEVTASSIVLMDEVTAGLLGAGFQFSRTSPDAFVLQGEQLRVDTARPLLGKPTPCVGREQELALLEFTLSSCIEEPAAQALLVTAPPGVGKSRLRHEFLRRLERREQPVQVILGRGDPMSAGASHGLLGQALRLFCGIVEGEELASHRTRLAQRVSRHLPASEARETVEFLGELCAIPFPEEASPRLRAARGDPRLMSAQVGRALVTFLRAECAHQPVLLVLEDLHWSDALTIKLVDEALCDLAEQPFMVLALARPEVKSAFPSLWKRCLQELPLKGLSRKASARLVREVLGSQVPESVVQKAVEQSDGNALFLEELIRMLAEGRGEAPPETVLAVLQARLMRMEPGVRQTLLAASIFGGTFWVGGVRELLVRQNSGELLEEHVRWLVEQEVIEPQPDSHFHAEAQYRFRHALVRDAAYGLVPDGHRTLGHWLAADWLERMGELDPVVLATHYQRGEQLARAAQFYLQAAERLLGHNDLQGAMGCVDSALACGAQGRALVRARALQAVVAFWMYDFSKLLVLGGPELEELGAGSRLWCWVMGGLVVTHLYSGDVREHSAWLSQRLLSATPEPEAISAYDWAVACLGLAHVLSGSRWEVRAVLDRLWELVAGGMGPGWARYIQAFFHHHFEARPWLALVQAEQGMRDFRELGMERDALTVQTLSGMALAALGDVPGGVERIREVLAPQQGGAPLPNDATQNFLCQVLADSPEPQHRQEAQTQAREGLAGAENGHFFRQGMMHAVLAKVMTEWGAPREAELHARQACELLATSQTELIHARAYLSATLLAQGRVEEARQEAARGVQELEQMGNSGVYAVAMRLALVEACFAQGDVNAGEAALREALHCARTRASDIPDPSLRERFLRQVPENARTLELARQRWGELPG